MTTSDTKRNWEATQALTTQAGLMQEQARDRDCLLTALRSCESVQNGWTTDEKVGEIKQAAHDLLCCISKVRRVLHSS